MQYTITLHIANVTPLKTTFEIITVNALQQYPQLLRRTLSKKKTTNKIRKETTQHSLCQRKI